MRAALLLAASGCSLVTNIEVTAPPTVAATATPFALGDQRGSEVTLASLLATGDVALVFYRGHW